MLNSLNIDWKICKNAILISKYISNFYKELYTSKYNHSATEVFIKKIEQYIPTINNSYGSLCDSDITKAEIKKALFQ